MASSSSRIIQALTSLTLTLPPIIFFRDNFYSLYQVTGSTMEPSLYDGDILLVRKSDIYPDRLWHHWTSQTYDEGTEEAEEQQNALRVMALDAQCDRPIGHKQTAYTYLRPPSIYTPGCVVVFRAPNAEKYPMSEYRVKRVIGLGGQIVRNGSRHFELRRVPSYGLWVEGDNDEEEHESEPKSVDSRTFGAVSKNLLVGVAERVVWPPSRWGLIPCISAPVTRSWWA